MIRPAAARIFWAALVSTAATVQAGYLWRDVPLYGGGFSPGLIYRQQQPGRLYLRTNVGGAFRWNPDTAQWIPLSDAFGPDKMLWACVLSMATDPLDADRVYAAVGGYLGPWAGNGAILISTNRGDTWTEVPVPFKIGGNDRGEYTGERLQVDPNLPSTVFMAALPAGLWKSLDAGATWHPVPSLAPTNLNFICIDPASGTPGSASQRMIVGSMDTSNNLWITTNAGVTWAPIANQPAAYYPMHTALSGNYLFISYANVDGLNPQPATIGSVYRHDLSSGAWSNVTPASGTFGFVGLCVDKQNPGTVLAGTSCRWWPGEEIYRSTNNGASWMGVVLNGIVDESPAPYTRDIFQPCWITDIQINPFNSNEAAFVTAYGLYMTENLTEADAGRPVTWVFRDKGMEETVVLDLASPPTGPWLYSVVADVNGFRYDTLDRPPTNGAFHPVFPISSSIDFAALSPEIVVRTHTRQYNNDSGPRGSYSLDGGVTWTRFATEPAAALDSGVIAVSADGNTFLWTPAGQGTYYAETWGAGTYYSSNRGAAWTACSGLVQNLRPMADRVNPNKFYAYDEIVGRLFASTDGGVTFAVVATGLPTQAYWYQSPVTLKPVFGREGDLWLTGGNSGLYRSTNSGVTFARVPTVGAASRVAFGKAAPGRDYPAIYVVGTIGGVYGFYRSDDAAATWERINDDQHQFGFVNCLAGDPKLYGRVYVGTSGRGTVYGDPDSPRRPQLRPSNNDPAEWSIEFLSETGYDYVLQQATHMVPAMLWQNLSTNAGTGSVLTLNPPSALPSSEQWFRVKVQLPR